MGSLFTHRHTEVCSSLLRGLPRTTNAVFAPPLTIVFHPESYANLQVLTDKTPQKMWRYVQCGYAPDVTVANINLPNSRIACRKIEEFARGRRDAHLMIPIFLNGDHTTMLVLCGSEAAYFDPHNRYHSHPNCKLPYESIIPLLQQVFSLDFSGQVHNENWVWQDDDNLCTCWSHWYAYLRMQGMNHTTAGEEMHKSQIMGLLRFLRLCLRVPISVSTRRGETAERSLIEMALAKDRAISLLLHDSEHMNYGLHSGPPG